MQAKLIITFSGLSGANFLAKAGTIVDSLRNNPDFPEPWPAQVPSHGQLDKTYSAYRDDLHAASSGDRVKISQRETSRAALEALLKTLAPYLEMVAQGDTTKLMRTGYDLRKDIVRGTNTNPPPVPDGFIAKHNALSGSVILHASSVSSANGYEAYYTDGDPHDEAGWKDAGTFPGCNRIEIAHLAPGKTYWFRIRAFNSNGYGAWTDPASLIVV